MISEITHSSELRNALVKGGSNTEIAPNNTVDTSAIQGNLEALVAVNTPYEEKLRAERKQAILDKAKAVAMAGAIAVGGLVALGAIESRMGDDRTFQPVAGEGQDIPLITPEVHTQPGE